MQNALLDVIRELLCYSMEQGKVENVDVSIGLEKNIIPQ